MSDDTTQDANAANGEAPEGPPPTPFQMLCGSMAAQVQMAMGLIPDPTTGKPVLEMAAARQGIEMLRMLDEKTKGNLDEVEAHTLSTILGHLQMLFIQRVEQFKKAVEEQEKAKDEAPPEKPDEPDKPAEPAADAKP